MRLFYHPYYFTWFETWERSNTQFKTWKWSNTQFKGWRWSNISYAQFQTEELFGQDYSVLSLYNADGSLIVSLGLNPKELPQEKTEIALRAYKVEIRTADMGQNGTTTHLKQL